MKMEKYVESELSGILLIKLVTINIMIGSSGDPSHGYEGYYLSKYNVNNVKKSLEANIQGQDLH